MLLYTVDRRVSMLLPLACDVEWTNLTRVFSDDVPQTAGLGAITIAQQALSLPPAAAAALASSAGATRSTGYTPSTGAPAPPAQVSTSRQMNGVRLPIGANVTTNSAFLNGDRNRGFLLIQNNNSTGKANLLVSLDGPVDTGSPGFYLNLAPNFGILLDQAVLINPLYVAWGTGTVDLGGVCMYGSAVSAGPTLRNPATIAQLEQFGQNAQQINQAVF